VAEALRQIGATVRTQHEVFLELGILPQDERDEVWLRECGARSWVVLTKDQHIKSRRSELEALMAAGVATFVLKAGNMTGPDMCKAIVAAHPRILQFLWKYKLPFLAHITPAGGVKLATDPPKRGGLSK